MSPPKNEKKSFKCVGGAGAWVSTVANNHGLPVQSFFRRCLCIKHLRLEWQRDFDVTFRAYVGPTDAAPAVSAEDAYASLRQFFFMFNVKQDRDRFRSVCHYLLASIGCGVSKFNYMTILMNTELSRVWQRQILFILRICVRYLQTVQPDQAADVKDFLLFSQLIFCLTHPSQWKTVTISSDLMGKIIGNMTAGWMREVIRAGLYPGLRDVLMRGLARSKPALTRATLETLLSLVIRPMVRALFLCLAGIQNRNIVWLISTESSFRQTIKNQTQRKGRQADRQ